MNPDFDIYKLDDEHEYLRQSVRELCEAKVEPYAADVDEQERFPSEAHAALTKAGFHAIHIPEEYDGAGADSIASCIVIEEVARVCMTSSLIPAVNKLGSMPIILSASEELKKKVLPSIASGESMISYGLSEREAGSDAASMKTRAQKDGENYVLNGTKAWITNSAQSDWFTVMAVTDPEKRANGISAFAVHRDDEGFEVGAKERKLGIRGSSTCELHFSNCVIPADRMIGEEGTGFKTTLKTLDHTRPTIGAQAVGVAQGALDVALSYIKDRKQFGTRIADFQGIQWMVADMAMKIEAARQLCYIAAAKAERGEKNLGFISSASKCMASDVAMEVTTNAVQLLGGAGYTRDFPVERMMRDAKITQIYEGTNQIQRMVMARSIIGR